MIRRKTIGWGSLGALEKARRARADTWERVRHAQEDGVMGRRDEEARQSAAILVQQALSGGYKRAESARSVHGQSRVLSVVWGPLALGLMSVAKLQVSLVRLVRSTMLESLPACLLIDFMSAHGARFLLTESDRDPPIFNVHFEF